MKQFRNAVFTLNNYSIEDEGKLHELKYSYLVYGYEIAPKTGTPHLQGYMEFKTPQRFSTMKKKFPTIHLERRVSTAKKAAEYCKKGGKFVEFGEISQQGKRTDFHAIRDMAEDGCEIKDIAIEYPENYIKYSTGIEKIHDLLANKDELKKEFENIHWHKWQKKVIELSKKKPHDRKIVWIVDKKGGKGKTFLARYLTLEGAAYFQNAKSADIAYAYNGERVVVFDFTRDLETMLNYSILESIKNGIMFSRKYVSKCKIYNKPHVFVMSNWEPDKSKMSADRWCIITLKSGNTKPTSEPSKPSITRKTSEDVF